MKKLSNPQAGDRLAGRRGALKSEASRRAFLLGFGATSVAAIAEASRLVNRGGKGSVAGVALSITGTPPGSATQSAPYAGFLPTVTGGFGAKTFTLQAGTLPAGLALNSTNGAISGTPTGVGVSSGIVIRVTDSSGFADLLSFSIVVTSAGSMPTIVPSAGWAAGGDGWGGAYAAKPIDPLRLTAKPTLLPQFPQFQTLGGDFVIGFACHAKGGRSVDILVSGTRVAAAFLKWDYVDVNGASKSRYGWFARLDHAATLAMRTGTIEVIAEATATDGTMQKRVSETQILHIRSAANIYDIELTLDRSQASSGSRYQTIAAALDACVQGTKIRPHIVFKVSGDYPLGSTSVGLGVATTWATFECDAGVTVNITAPDITNSAASSPRCLRPSYDGLCFRGQRIVFDTDKFQIVYPGDESNWAWWWDGATITKSGNGPAGSGATAGQNGLSFGQPAELWVRTGKGGAANRLKCMWATDAILIDNPEGFYSFSGVVGCTMSGVSGDLLQNSKLVSNCEVSNFTSAAQRVETNVLKIFGPAGSTVSKAGFAYPLLLKVSGSTVKTINCVSADPRGVPYNPVWTTPQDVADAINAYGNGWSATVQDNTRGAAHLATLGNGVGDKSIANVSAAGAGLQLMVAFDIHSDALQHFPDNYATDKVPVAARATGSGGNSITLAKTGTATTISGATLSGGAAGVNASGYIQLTKVPADGDTVTVNGAAYTWKLSPTLSTHIQITGTPGTLPGAPDYAVNDIGWCLIALTGVLDADANIVGSKSEELLLENLIFEFTKIADSGSTQMIFNEGNYRDYTIANLTIEGDASAFVSQMSGKHSHFWISHLTLDKQTLFIRTPDFIADAYCGVTLSALENFGWMNAAAANFPFDRCHIRKLSSAPSGTFTNCGFGANAAQTTLFNGPAANDYSPIANGPLKMSDGNYAGDLLPNGARNLAA